MNPKGMTMEQLSEAIGEHGGSEAFVDGFRKGRIAAKKKARADRMKAAQVKAFGGKR